MVTFIAVYGSLMILSAALSGIVALFKRRDTSYWITASFLFPPALILLLLMPKNVRRLRRRETMDEQEARELRRDDGDRVF
jgi:hypothetical protein